MFSATSVVRKGAMLGAASLAVSCVGAAVLSTPAQAGSLTCNGKKVTLVAARGTVNGSSRADVILITAPHVKVNAGAGDDTVCGSSAADIVDGGAGNDTIIGFDGPDSLAGGVGNDRIDGGGGSDSINGGAGNDVETGSAGNDVLSGGLGRDNLNGGVGNDVMSGGADNDVLSGFDGADSVSGNEGNDVLSGGAGNDDLSGGTGDDSLNGGAGLDNVDGNDGVDTLIGGTGADSLHVDDADHHSDPSNREDHVGSDSEYANVPTLLAAQLNVSAKYLSDGIKAGDITGSGKQATLPAAPHVGQPPVSDLLTAASWNVVVKNNRIQMRGCVDGSADAPDVVSKTFFKIRLEPREGDDAGVGRPRPPRITLGRCEDNFVPPVVPASLLGQLTANANYLGAEISDGTLTGSNVGTKVPYNNVSPVPDGSMITLVQYSVKPSRGKDPEPVEAKFCISGHDGTSSDYRFVGQVHGTSTTGEVFAGACMPSQGGHDLPDLGEPVGL